MSLSPPRRFWVIALRALGLGFVAAIVLPILLLIVTLAISHLAGGCGPGSSGGCEMGAAALAMLAVLPCFVIGMIVSVVRDLRS